MAEIKSIDKKTVHQICSGQVIVDLAVAVKELLENSLDAGATIVEVKFKEWGLDQIEVVDNGKGVELGNLAALTLKHHTSKLKEFSDLTNVETFGFRGEALSSLCGLCDVTICTKHIDSSVGYKIEYDHNGRIVNQTHAARQTGTTVFLKNMFVTLPVRYKEFKKNIKREYTKALSLLSAYCVISTDVKISCSNQTGKSKRTNVVTTNGSSSIQQNIASVFGAKQLQTLTAFKQVAISDQICLEYNLKLDEANHASQYYNVTGMISNANHGWGRSAPDRQFYYVNSRPISLPRLAKIINEVYHAYNRHQYPFVVLNIEAKRDDVDVNVTPDKRQVFFHNEKVLLCLVKSSLLELYSSKDGNVIDDVTQTTITSGFLKTCTKSAVRSIKNQGCDTPVPKLTVTHTSQELAVTIPVSRRSNSSNFDEKKSTTNAEVNLNVGGISVAEENISPIMLLTKYRRKNTDDTATPRVFSAKKRSVNQTSSLCSHTVVSKQPKIDCSFNRNRGESSISASNIEQTFTENHLLQSGSSTTKCDFENVSTLDLNDNQDSYHDNESSQEFIRIVSDVSSDLDVEEESSTHCTEYILDSPPKRDDFIRTETLKFSFSKLTKLLKLKREITKLRHCEDQAPSFRVKIEPKHNEDAEKELSRNLKKDAFTQMIPIGQFNLGFIIAKLQNDLFIIDQHASDEIYNFETLQKTTEIHSQNFVAPQKLDLTPADQVVLMENISIFHRNGFGFVIKMDEDSNQETVFLSKVPMSKNYQFGSSDVEELIFMLADAPGVMCRPSRLRLMFASRACRKSIMIGTALQPHEMLRLIKHMSEISHPWNCPHGRPTMRHLVDISRISMNNDNLK